RQSSSANLAPGHRAAHCTACRCPSLVAATVRSPSVRPSSSTATIVWVRLCASTPITTMPAPPATRKGNFPGQAARARLNRAPGRHLSSHTAARRRGPAGPHIKDKPPAIRPGQQRNERTLPGSDDHGINAKKAVARFRTSTSSRSRRFSRRSSASSRRSALASHPCHRSRDRACIALFLVCFSPRAGSELGTTRGAAEGLLIVSCGYLGRYVTHGWAEAPLKVLLRRWAHGNARPDAESVPGAPLMAAAAPAKRGREETRPVRRAWRAALAWPPRAGHGISLETTGPVPGAARLGRVAGPLLAVAVTGFAAAQYAIGHPLAPQ